MSTNRVYHKINGYDNLPTIYIADIDVFEELLDKYVPDFIFVSTKKQTIETEEKDLIGRTKSTEKEVSVFSFHNEGIVYAVNGMNYDTIADYREGQDKGYVYGDEYYEAKEGGFADYEEYSLCKEAGFTDRDEYLKAQELGFVGGGEKLQQAFNTAKLNEKEYTKVKGLKNDAAVFAMAADAGFENYDEFENALAKGFVSANASDYREALEKGFDDSETYMAAQEGNFASQEEYESAKDLGITDKHEWEQYNRLLEMQNQYNFRTVEQTHLFDILADLPEGKKMSIARTWDALKEGQNSLLSSRFNLNKWFNEPVANLFKGSKKLPNWYTTSFKDIVEVKVFLISNENVGQIGLYDADGEVFERSATTATPPVLEVVKETTIEDTAAAEQNTNEEDAAEA